MVCVVINLLIDNLGVKIIVTDPMVCKPRHRRGCVNYVISVVKKGQPQPIHDYMNTVAVSGNIMFTREEEPDKNLPLLEDAWFIKMEDGTIKCMVLRNQYHRDLYFTFTSLHLVHQKLQVVRPYQADVKTLSQKRKIG